MIPNPFFFLWLNGGGEERSPIPVTKKLGGVLWEFLEFG